MPEGAPKLLFVSAGTEEANREMGLASTVVLDQQFAAGRAFGATGTPSAVLVDAEGRVASEVAVGAPAVLELAKATQTEVYGLPASLRNPRGALAASRWPVPPHLLQWMASTISSPS
jgi:hypothetical protein